MSKTDHSSAADDPRAARLRLREMLDGFEETQLICVAARLGIADVLASGPLGAEALAAQLGVDGSALFRVLRALVWCEVLEQGADQRFALTPLGALLATDVEGSLRHRAVVVGELEYPAWGALLDGMRSGSVAFDSVFGESFYGRLSAVMC